MKRLTTMAALMLSIAGAIQAQEIKGRVIDHEGQPVPYANVVLHTADSAYVAGTVTDDEGVFALTERAQGTLLHVTYIGYRPVWQAITTGTANHIQLQPDTQYPAQNTNQRRCHGDKH